ncbi:uncharacterized protein LOC125242080 [Leguminivora glycinivorella]|uniref:uncharacterized protein LOC125242080 n=1 Tax=Leguminivora glycinivorella TaxID=1035111 RepID=UPI0020105704|nr:uncharacterized protein LOC125242080 [Leguminivora glycinivorella]
MNWKFQMTSIKNARLSRASTSGSSRARASCWQPPRRRRAPLRAAAARRQVLVSLQLESSNPAAIPTLSRYMRIQQLKAHFWSRYYTEYITELQKRQKWRKQGQQLHLGEMVLVKDDRLPPNQWLLGRVTRLYPGSDGVTRVADIKTTSGTLRRAFNRLCPLPVIDTNSVPEAATC